MGQKDQKSGYTRLWISYPWNRQEDQDFTYLVSALENEQIQATYDSLQMQHETCLWQRVTQRLQSVDFDGWLYVLTHQFLSHKKCTDDFIAALNQIGWQMGQEFPMVGLLHGVGIQHVPPAIRVRPCISAFDPDWRQRVSEAIKERASSRKNSGPGEARRFVWKIHSCYRGNPHLTAIEVCPKRGSMQYWRFAIPKGSRIALWGVGPAGGAEISPIKFGVVKGYGRYGNAYVSWFGAANGLSNKESAYAVFSGPVPDFVCFGPPDGASGLPGHMEIFRVGRGN